MKVNKSPVQICCELLANMQQPPVFVTPTVGKKNLCEPKAKRTQCHLRFICS